MWKELEANSLLISWKIKISKGKQNDKASSVLEARGSNAERLEQTRSHRKDMKIIIHTDNYLGQRMKGGD